jgi:hypothetical protein
MELLTAQLTTNRHPEGGRNRRAGMPGTELIVFTFFALQEAAQPAFLANGVEAPAAAGQNLVWIRLMPDIPDDFVDRRIKDVMQSEGDLN